MAPITTDPAFPYRRRTQIALLGLLTALVLVGLLVQLGVLPRRSPRKPPPLPAFHCESCPPFVPTRQRRIPLPDDPEHYSASILDAGAWSPLSNPGPLWHDWTPLPATRGFIEVSPGSYLQIGARGSNLGFLEQCRPDDIQSLGLGYRRTRGALRSITHLRGLLELAIADESITDDDLVYLAYFPCLQRLSLGRPPFISDASMPLIGRLTQLRVLEVNSYRITDVGVRHLGSLTELRELSLGGSQVTDASLRRLGELPNLVELEISKTLVTARGINAFSPSPSLKGLHLIGTAIDSRDSISAFISRHPQCLVEFGPTY